MKKKVKIIYCITRPEPGGAQAHVRDLLYGFNHDSELHLVTSNEGFLTEEASRLGVGVHILPSLVQPLAPIKDCKAVAEMLQVIRRVKPELLHCHSSKAGLVGRIAGKIAGVPSIFTAHGWAFTDGTSWMRKAIAIPSEWFAARLAKAIISVSEYDYNLAINYKVASKNKMYVIPNGIFDTSYRADPTLAEARIIMVARFDVPKDHKLLVQALAGLKELSWRLDLVGDGPVLASAQIEAQHLGLVERVQFLGSRSDVPELLTQQSVFVLTSNYEGFPISILEAMRAGLPVVASDVGGVKEAVIDGETGFLIPRGDVSTLRRRLEQLITDPALRARMGAAGRKRYETHFTLDQMLAKTLAVYEKVLGTNPGRKLV